MRGYSLKRADRIARRVFYDPKYHWWAGYADGKLRQRAIGMLRKTRKRCSCWMCGHRRHYDGPPTQERRQMELAPG